MKPLKKLHLGALRLKLAVEDFIGNRQGTAAVEFALLAPLMIATYFGTVEVSRAYIIKNKVEAVSETIADLVAQGKSTTTSELADMFKISSKSLTPSQEAGINLVVTAVRTEPNDDGEKETKVTWSESKDGTKTYSKGTTFTDLPDGITKNYETIIVTELYYNHTSIMEYFVKGTKKFDRRFITKPRYSSDIPCSDC